MLEARMVSIGTTAVDLLAGVDLDLEYELIVKTGTVNVALFIGASDVSSTNGFSIGANEMLRLRLHGERVFAVTLSGTAGISLLAYSV